MKRLVFSAVLLSSLCLGPVVAVGTPNPGEMSSAFQRMGMPEWPFKSTIERRNFGLPVWAIFAPPLVRPSSPSLRSVPPTKRIAAKVRPAQPTPRLTVITLTKHIKPAAMEDKQFIVGALY
jgi:hypothetical protein